MHSLPCSAAAAHFAPKPTNPFSTTFFRSMTNLHRASRGSEGSADSKYLILDLSMIDLVRGLNGASFERFIGGDESAEEDDLPPDDTYAGQGIPLPGPAPPSLPLRKRISTNMGLRSRLSNQNLVGFFGKKEEDEKPHRLLIRGRTSSLGKSLGKAIEPQGLPSEGEKAQSTDTLLVIGEPKQEARESTDALTLTENKGAEKKEVREERAEEVKEAKEAKEAKKADDVEDAKEVKETEKNKEEEEAGKANAKEGKEKGKRAKKEKAKATEEEKGEEAKEKVMEEEITEGDKTESRLSAFRSLDPGKIEQKVLSEKSDDSHHTGTSWMRKSASSLFPSARDGANTLPVFHRWSALFSNEKASENITLYTSRTQEDFSAVAGSFVHDGIVPGHEDCTENKRVYWKKLFQGGFFRSRKTSRVKEQPFYNSAPLNPKPRAEEKARQAKTEKSGKKTGEKVPQAKEVKEKHFRHSTDAISLKSAPTAPAPPIPSSFAAGARKPRDRTESSGKEKSAKLGAKSDRKRKSKHKKTRPELQKRQAV